MITISKPISAGQAQAYHQEEFTNARENYYTQGERVRGEWHGRLAEEWGLKGEVSEEQFSRLANGQHPETAEQLVRHRESFEYQNEKGDTVKTMEHRAGWDATFSAPKSVSLTALVGGDERVREAHRESVGVALDELERFVQARMGGNNPAETTGKWIAAKFEHDSARPVDGYAAPQLHTHVVFFNLTQTEDGKARAIQPQELYKSQQYGTAVYQAELGYRLRELGYEIAAGKNGAPEIKGYSQEYLEASSPRSQQIRAHLQEHGLEGAGPAQIAAHRTRDAKSPLSAEEMFERHRVLADAHGNQAQRVVEEARTRGPQEHHNTQESQTRAQEALTYSRDRHIEREAVVGERDLMRDALRRGMGETSFREVRENFEQRLGSREFVEVGQERTGTVGRSITTREMLDYERDNIAQMKAGQGRHEPLASEQSREDLAGKFGHLSNSQRQAVEEILSSRDQVVGLEGTAGAGKTTSLAAIREAAERQGYQVEGLAPTSRAAHQLEEAGIQSSTLQHHLAKSHDPHDERHLYVVDESSLASTRQVNDFLHRMQDQDRVLLVGDTRQHQGVEAGRPFQQLQEAGMHTAHLDEIIRQKDPALRHAVEQLANGQVQEAIENLRQQGRVHEITNREQRLEAIARAYAERPDNTLVVSPDNRSRQEINERIHGELQSSGRVQEQEHQVSVLVPRQEMTGADRQWAAQYEPGDIVRYSRGSNAVGVEAGEYGRVTGIDQKENLLTVERDNGQQVTYDPHRLHGVSVYREAEREFSAGDRVQFTAPYRDEHIANRQLGTVERIDAEGNLQIRLDSGRDVQFNIREHPHLDYGYAVTSHSSQGATADRVLVHVDTEQAHEKLVNTRLAYVSVSRGRYDAQIYTNDAGKLGEELSREVSKESALDAGMSSGHGQGAGHTGEESRTEMVSRNPEQEREEIQERSMER
jgi:conjugative relaxase-like TrwC/TraI family protein